MSLQCRDIQLWHMRSLGVSVYWRYLTFSQKVPKNAFYSKSLPKLFGQKSTWITLLTMFLTLEMNFMQFGWVLVILWKKSFYVNFDLFWPPYTKKRKFWSKLVFKSWKIGYYHIFVWGIWKNWSRDDLPTPRFQLWRFLLK